MRRYLLVPLLLAVSCAGSGHARRPVAVLYEDEPWSRGIVPSASPLVALYDDGLVIYQDGRDGGAPRYVRAVLDERELAALEDALPPGLFALDRCYSLFEMPHHPFNVLHLWRNGVRTTMAVYGDLGPGSELRSRCPPAFLEARDALAGLRIARATPWHPDTVLVYFTVQELRGEARRPWPPTWPGLSAATTRRSDDGYGIHLDYAHLPELTGFLANPADSHAAVVIDGHPGLVTWVVPLPCHAMWDGSAGDDAAPAR